MKDATPFEVIIIGGSYAGLSAALALGRSLRNVLVIDAGKPCNRQTPHSHNFITHDGRRPAEISGQAKDQVLQYPTVSFLNDLVVSATRESNEFHIRTEKGKSFVAKKILLATGISDLMPDIKGFKECWGISVLHCPYCHGYEVRNTKIGILGNGEQGLELVKLIQNWSKDLVLFTNGPSSLSPAHMEITNKLKVTIVESPIAELEHTHGQLKNIVLQDGSIVPLQAVFARVPFKHHTAIAEQLGCEFTEMNFIKATDFGQTTVEGVFAAGDNSTPMRSVSIAVANGTKAGAWINHTLIESAFQ